LSPFVCYNPSQWWKVTLSADWIKFEYHNIAEADNELTWAAEEEAPEVSPPSVMLGNPYMFTGRRFDLETGLYYYRARYYNPYIGRFLQTDPIGYGYGYCGNNPIGFVDPSGCHEENRYYHFHFTMPAEIIVDNPGSFLDSELKNKTSQWFKDNYVLSDHPGWVINEINVGTFQDGSVAIELIFYYMENFGPLYDPPPDTSPKLKTEFWELKEAGVPFRTVPVLVVDDNGILTNRLLDMVIEKAVHRVNQWRRQLFWCGARLYLNSVQNALLRNCDTPFATAPLLYWKYYGTIYDRTQINYILEGHAMHHFKIPYESGITAVYYHNWTSNDNIASLEEVYWFSKGFWGYWWRDEW